MNGEPRSLCSQPGCLIRQALVLIVSVLLGGAWSWGIALPSRAAPTPPLETASVLQNQPPVVGQVTRLYEGSYNTGTPDTQGFLYLADFGASATQSFSNGVTLLDTTPSQADHAGYFSMLPLTLDRASGYTLRFTAQVLSESHANNDRAGFSVIALSSDLKGIELGFWEDEIWAQEGGLTPILFTHAEDATFDTTTGMIPYELTIQGDRYALATGSTPILSGTVRDYTAFSGFPDPYETPNLVFLGDDTTSASAVLALSAVQVVTNAVPTDRETPAGLPLPIDDVGVLDIDANGNAIVLTMTVQHGVLTATTTVPGGLSASEIDGNGSALLTLHGAPGTINATLLSTGGLRYQSYRSFGGTENLTAVIDDRGSTEGPGLTDSKTWRITVTNPGGQVLFLPIVLRQQP